MIIDILETVTGANEPQKEKSPYCQYPTTRWGCRKDADPHSMKNSMGVNTNAFGRVWQTESPIHDTGCRCSSIKIQPQHNQMLSSTYTVEDVNDVRADELGLQMNGEY